MKTGLLFSGRFTVLCFDKDGKPKWIKDVHNTVLDAALDAILDVLFHGITPVGTWYLGLLDDGPTIDPTDIMTSHVGWTESIAYEGDRQAFVEAAADGQALSNSANPAVFAINDTVTIAGAFLCGAATGTSCLLFCAAVFEEGDAVVESGDSINVVYEIQAADAGV